MNHGDTPLMNSSVEFQRSNQPLLLHSAKPRASELEREMSVGYPIELQRKKESIKTKPRHSTAFLSMEKVVLG